MKTCCFIGHRNVEKTPELCEKIRETVVQLIQKHNVQNFLFGSKSKFNSLCVEIVNQIKKQYSKIKLTYFRSHFPYISQEYKNYLLEDFDDTLMPKGVENAGKASYVERNQAMIKESDFCIFYFDENYQPPLRKLKKGFIATQPKSGTKVAYDFALKSKKRIINLFTN